MKTVPLVFTLVVLLALSCLGSARLAARYLYDGVPSLFLSEDTAYAPGYREEVFRTLGLPAPPSEIERQLGPPLYKAPATRGESWIYSTSPSNTNYRLRGVRIEGGMVVDTFHEFVVD